MTNALNIGNVALPGDGYPSLYGFSIPVLNGLEGAYLFGEGVSQMSRNYAPGKPNATVVGTPVSGQGFATFSETGYLNTGIIEGPDMTMITVCRDGTGLSDAAPGYMGNNFSTAGGGMAIVIGNATNLRGTNIRAGALEFINVTGNPLNFTAQCLRARNLAPTSFDNMSSGVSLSSSSSGVRTLDTTNPILIGRIPSNAFKGSNDQILAMVYSRAITDTEVSQLTLWAREYCAAKGFSV